jgi:carboxylesterase
MAPDRSSWVLGPADGVPALLLHGLGGSPWDLRPLGEALAEHGYRASCPCLAGHTDVEALAASSWTDWYRSAEMALLGAGTATDTRATLLIGFSMGSLLAARLAALHPAAISGLVMMGVPVEQPRWQVRGASLVVALQRRSPGLAKRIGHHRKRPSDVRRKAVADQRAGFPTVPYATIVELARLQAEAFSLLPRVRVPTLLLHGAYDHVAPVEGSVRVSQTLGASFVQRVVLPNSFHHVARDVDHEQLCAEVLAFGRAHAGVSAPAGTSTIGNST